MTNQKSPARSGPPMPVTPENPFGLTEAERVFVATYIKEFNGPAAAMAGGWKNRNVCWRLLERPEIRGAIQAAIHQRQRMVQRMLGSITLDSERVLLEIARICFADPRNLFDEHGALKSMDDWDQNTAAAVAKIKTKELYEERDVMIDGVKVKKQVLVGYLREVSCWDKNSALDKAMKHLGGYELDNAQKNSLSDKDTASLKKAREMLAEILAKHQKKVDNKDAAS